MTLTATGLTNGGTTTHYRFQYDDSLSAPINPGGPEPARTNAVLAACENDFNLMSGWFGNIALDVNFTIAVNVTQNSGGASWSLSGGNLSVTINPGNGAANFVRYLLVSEMVEQFMRAQGKGWYGSGTEGSEGEGLSRFLAAQFLSVNGLGNPPANFTNSNSWLSSPRNDYVNNINPTDDGPDAITGCSLLFIYYLFSQLGFSINDIVAAGASTLGGVYRNLTSDTSDPFPFFKQLMDTAFPGTATITTGNLDNPFPLGILSFWVDKSTFGRDEVTDVIASASNGQFPNAFWLVLEGLNINIFNRLGVGIPALSGPFASLPGISLSLNNSGNVRVFFRLWSTQTADTGFDPSSTYLSHQDSGKPHWPLVAPDSHTIPFFATGNSPNLSDSNNPEYGTNGINNRTIIIPSGDSAWAYFGCFLNVYDPSNVVNGSQVQALLTGTHHCLVAEIAYDDAPIINANGVVASPENSDKLAQRNLQLTFSDNPGPEATHRIPQTFDLKPGSAIVSTSGSLLDYPDELMIDWGSTPVGSLAHIYWPQVSASEVLALSNRLYGTHLLSASDGNTITCKTTRGVTYVPIPPGATANIAGLLTVDLPTTVTVGQEFNIIVRRVSTRRVEVIPAPPPPRIAAASQTFSRTATPQYQPAHEGGTHSGGTYSIEAETLEDRTVEANTEAVDVKYVMRNWRYIAGTFQVKIPVTTSQVMLRPEEDTLAIMKWRLEKMVPSNRWYPVLQRYISYISARIEGLGGNPNAIPPSPDGAPSTVIGEPKPVQYTGKVIEVIYDCFGDLEGFVLGDCCTTQVFKTREWAIGEIAIRACRERLLLSVYLEEGHQPRIRKLVIRY